MNNAGHDELAFQWVAAGEVGTHDIKCTGKISPQELKNVASVFASSVFIHKLICIVQCRHVIWSHCQPKYFLAS